MVIQRIQSLYLLIAAVLMGLLCFIVPVVDFGEGVKLYIYEIVPMLTLDALIAILLFVDIFLFQNLKLQMRVARISTVLIVCSAIIEAWMLNANFEDGHAYWLWSAVILVVSFVLTLLALRGMQRDYRLLRSSDTIR